MKRQLLYVNQEIRIWKVVYGSFEGDVVFYDVYRGIDFLSRFDTTQEALEFVEEMIQ